MAWEARPMGGDLQRPLANTVAAAAVVTPMIDQGDKELLERLSSGRVDAAWSEFLARYSPLIMHVIRRHDDDDDRTTECFNHVCAALSDDGFRRVLSFRPDGPARFKTWLIEVVANLCVDWRRQERGRVRRLHCVARGSLGRLAIVLRRRIREGACQRSSTLALSATAPPACRCAVAFAPECKRPLAGPFAFPSTGRVYLRFCIG